MHGWNRVATSALALAIIGAGCGDDSVTEPETRISTEGGTVTSADGKVSLVVPAGALAEPTAITIEPAPPSADGRLLPGTEYIFSPDGLRFAVPAQLAIRFDSIPASLVDQAQWIWLHRREGNGWTPVKGQPIDLATRTIRGEITGFSNYGGATSLLASDHALAALQLSVLLNDAVATNVIALLETISSILLAQNDPVWQALAAPFMAGMGTTACTAFDNAVNNASNVLVDDWGKLMVLLRPVYAWHAVAASLYGPDGCPNAPLGFIDVQDRKVTEFVDFYVARLDPASFDQNFDRLIEEATFVLELRGDVQLFGLPDSDVQLQTRAQWPLMDEVRAAAYNTCRVDGRHEFLGRLRTQVEVANYTDEDLLTDLQLCATQLAWQLTSADGTIGCNGSLGGGSGPGTETIEASTDGIVNGTIRLVGDVRAFLCPDGTFAPDELTVTLNGTDVHTATGCRPDASTSAARAKISVGLVLVEAVRGQLASCRAMKRTGCSVVAGRRATADRSCNPSGDGLTWESGRKVPHFQVAGSCRTTTCSTSSSSRSIHAPSVPVGLTAEGVRTPVIVPM